MATHAEFRKLASYRLKEAKLLLANGYYDGAVYLCGYVLEMALKARICKHLKVNEYPEKIGGFKIHEFSDLLILSGLKNKINASYNQLLFRNWNLLTTWEPDMRYKPIGTATIQAAKDLIDALENPVNGVFKFIKKRW